MDSAPCQAPGAFSNMVFMDRDTFGTAGRWAMALLAPLALAACALLPPTTAVAMAPSPKRPEGPGERISRNSGGQITSSAEYWIDAEGNEIRHGVEAQFWPDGSPKAHREFNQGTPSGRWKTFYQDGTLRSDHELQPGQATPMVYFHPNGQDAAKGLAVAGQRTGDWSYWFASGVLAEEGGYLKGRRHGPWRFYLKDGKLKEEALYESGKRVAR
ncbi:MAG: hypothetical protein P1V35_11440 [Planctomycetota bacterium]|nr:hypothetical protein [Planctomycetota bacterium]